MNKEKIWKAKEKEMINSSNHKNMKSLTQKNIANI